MPYPEKDKQKIAELAKKMLFGMIDQGKLDPDDAEAVKTAAEQAVKDAKDAYYAVQDFLK